MKTPEQIAADTYWSLADDALPDSPNGDDYRSVMARAIEADRAQRPTLDESEFDQLIDAMSALVRGLERGVEYITLADARRAEELIRSKFGPALYEDWQETQK